MVNFEFNIQLGDFDHAFELKNEKTSYKEPEGVHGMMF